MVNQIKGIVVSNKKDKNEKPLIQIRNILAQIMEKRKGKEFCKSVLIKANLSFSAHISV